LDFAPPPTVLASVRSFPPIGRS